MDSKALQRHGKEKQRCAAEMSGSAVDLNRTESSGNARTGLAAEKQRQAGQRKSGEKQRTDEQREERTALKRGEKMTALKRGEKREKRRVKSA